MRHTAKDQVRYAAPVLPKAKTGHDRLSKEQIWQLVKPLADAGWQRQKIAVALHKAGYRTDVGGKIYSAQVCVALLKYGGEQYRKKWKKGSKVLKATGTEADWKKDVLTSFTPPTPAPNQDEVRFHCIATVALSRMQAIQKRQLLQTLIEEL